MEQHAVVTDDGVRIAPASRDEMAVRVTDFRVNGRIASMKIHQPTRMNKRFVRALHKIGFELLCLNRGAEFVLSKRFDPLRSYILRGQGSRDMVLTTSAKAGSWEQPIFQLVTTRVGRVGSRSYGLQRLFISISAQGTSISRRRISLNSKRTTW